MVTQCSDSYEKMSVSRGYHNYMYIEVNIWTPIMGKELFLEAQDNNEHDKHIDAVMKDGCVIRHIPRSISQVS